MSDNLPNGRLRPDCTFDAHKHMEIQKVTIEQLRTLNTNWNAYQEGEKEKTKWMNEYINRTMPIRSHFWILVGSLSILASFAAVMRFIEKMNI